MRSVAPRLAAVLILCVVAAPLPAADTKDTADLFPAGTLAYLEFRQPAQLSREVAALLKGSALEDMPTKLAKHRDKRADNNAFFFDDFVVSYLGMFASPEMVAEFGRLQGGAVALTGFNKNMEAEIVGILLSGSSNGPTFIMRTALTVDPYMRRTDECEGIALYREKKPDFRKKEAAVAPDFSGPTYALLPDGLIIGTSTDSVKEMIRRLKGKTSDPSLASVSAFRSAATLRNKPGLFGYADLAALNAQLEEAMKTASPPAVLQWKSFQALLSPKAGKQATVSLTLSNGSLELTARVGLDAKESSPLVSVFPEGKADVELLHFVPKDSGVALTMALADGEKRWTQGLALADALAKADGKRGQTASKQIAEMEEALKIKFGKDLFDKITGAAVVVDPLALGLNWNPARLAVLSATDADAAKALEEDILPKLAGLLPKGSKEPKRETIQGHRITAIQDADLFFGRHGKTLVLGQSSKEVAEALTAGAKKGGLLGEARTAAALKEVTEASMIGVLPLGSLLAIVTPLESPSRRFAPVPPGAAPAPPQPKGIDPIRAKLTKDLARAGEAAPPAVLLVERKPEQVTLVLKQANLRAISAKLVNVIVETSLERVFNTEGGGNAVLKPPAVKN